MNREADAPWWWQALFVALLTFAAGYWVYLHVFEAAPTPREAYADAKLQALSQGGTVSEEELLGMTQESLFVDGGKKAFRRYCVECHAEKGQGRTGPNLTDGHWLHGGTPLEIYKTVFAGQTQKGMPAWGPSLGAAKVKQLTVYLLSIKNSNVPGKAPEGRPVP